MKKKSKTEASEEVKLEEGLFKRSLVDQAENDTNMLVHTGKKKSKGEEKSNEKPAEKKKLSHKEKKRLEKVVERKNKTLNVIII